MSFDSELGWEYQWDSVIECCLGDSKRDEDSEFNITRL